MARNTSGGFVMPDPRVEPTPRRIRVRVGDEVVADSRRAQLLVWFAPPRWLPTYCLPAADVRTELLVPVPGVDDAGPLGPTVVADLRVGDRVLERVARRFVDPPGGLEALDGTWTFPWDQGVAWYEEALEVHVHARDPRKRVDVVPSDRHVRVELDGVLLAESRRAHAVFETDLPTRWYLPPEDVRGEELEPSTTISRCPYKGTARYWSVRTDEELQPDLAWSYTEPLPECPRIGGLVAFFNEKVDLVVDGVRQERPQTPWS